MYSDVSELVYNDDGFISPVTIPFQLPGGNENNQSILPRSENDEPSLPLAIAVPAPFYPIDQKNNCNCTDQVEEIATPYNVVELPVQNDYQAIAPAVYLSPDNVESNSQPQNIDINSDDINKNQYQSAIPIPYNFRKRGEFNLNSISEDSVVIEAEPAAYGDDASLFQQPEVKNSDEAQDVENFYVANSAGYNYPKPPNPMEYPEKLYDLPNDAVRSFK